ncbi:14d33352-ad85-4275-8648-71262e5a93ea [Thermothielavioides terrestris]|uniref:14d33352-ad85-4275-8648-71262e5a93ea n=1 Tax=Thermothielavioides terrestris TaxID=2587410 RepID=A0A3S4EU33_9PEZI|nr:14d33352-ad85-4275-8648-71262e5a93ea [Thermothielavioides terrestris]
MAKRASAFATNHPSYFTRHRAIEHKLTGWVRNTDNNKVEGEVQGEEDAIAAFLKHVDKGPRHAHVVRLDKEDREVVEGETEFVIRH